MAIAFVKGIVTRTPYYKEGDSTPFAALSLKETFFDKNGEERLGGYHDVVAFGGDAQRLAALEEGNELEVKASVRYRADKRFVSTQDSEKNPFTVQFVVMDIISTNAPELTEEEDIFPDA